MSKRLSAVLGVVCSFVICPLKVVFDSGRFRSNGNPRSWLGMNLSVSAKFRFVPCMYKVFFLAFFPHCTFVICRCSGQDKQDKSLACRQIISRLVANREKIPAGILEFSITTTEANGYDEFYEGLVRNYKVAFAGSGSSKKVIIHWKNKSKGWTETYLKRSDGVLHDPGQWSLHAKYADSNNNIINPLTFGIEGSSLSSSGYDGTLPEVAFWGAMSADWPIELEEVQYDGANCAKIVISLDLRSKKEAWVALVSQLTSLLPRKVIYTEISRFARSPIVSKGTCPTQFVLT